MSQFAWSETLGDTSCTSCKSGSGLLDYQFNSLPSGPAPEFRAEAVRVALTSGLSRTQVAADSGVGFSTLSRWFQQDRRNPEKPAAQSDLEREVAEILPIELGGCPLSGFLCPALLHRRFRRSELTDSWTSQAGTKRDPLVSDLCQ